LTEDTVAAGVGTARGTHFPTLVLQVSTWIFWKLS
jgi:hypothetical protein